MVTTGIHGKDTNSLSDFELFDCINNKIFHKSDLYYRQIELKNFSLDVMIVSTSKI